MMMVITQIEAAKILLLVGFFVTVGGYWGYRFKKIRANMGVKYAALYIESALLLSITSNLAKIIIDTIIK